MEKDNTLLAKNILELVSEEYDEEDELLLDCIAPPKVREPLPPILPRVHPGPARLLRALEVDEVDDNRFFFCTRYTQCLQIASRWPGFSCTGCPLQEPNKGVSEDHLVHISKSRKFTQ